MTVNSQSEGAVSGSPEEGFQLMQRVRVGRPHVEKNQLFGFLCGSPKLKAKRMGFAIPLSRTEQNDHGGTSATRENLLQSGAHSVKSIVLSPCKGFSIKFSLRFFFSPSDLFLARVFFLSFRYYKVDLNECCKSSLESDLCHAL